MVNDHYLLVGNDILAVGNHFLLVGNDILMVGDHSLIVGGDYLVVGNDFLNSYAAFNLALVVKRTKQPPFTALFSM